MKQMLMKIAVVLMAAMMMTSVTGCMAPFEEKDEVGEYTPIIDPASVKGSSTTVTVDLWLPIRSREYFVQKKASVSVSSGERKETAVLRALFAVTASEDILYSAVWPELQVVNVTDDGTTLYVTLNKAFLSPPTDNGIDSYTMARTVVLSITNTLIALGEYNQVQIMVEMEAGGTTQRPTRIQAGFTGDNSTNALGPMMADSSMLLTPERSVDIACKALENKDVVGLYDIITQRTISTDTLEFFAVQSTVQTMKYSIESYSIEPGSYQSEDIETTIFVNATLIDASGVKKDIAGMPLTLLRTELGIWKVEYSSLEKAIILAN